MWLKNNIRSLIALLFTLGVLGIFVLMLFRPIKTADNLSLIIVTSIINIYTFILGYYFGSSKNPTPPLNSQSLKIETSSSQTPQAMDNTSTNNNSTTSNIPIGTIVLVLLVVGILSFIYTKTN